MRRRLEIDPLGIAPGDRSLIEAIPRALTETERVCASINVASTRAGSASMGRCSLASLSRSSGCAIRIICSSFCFAVSRLVSSRNCSSTLSDRFCASSMSRIVRRPFA